MSNEIKENVIKLRKKLGYTQADIARLLGIKRSTYSNQEKNGSFRPEIIIKLSDILEVTPNDILKKEDELDFTPLDPLGGIMQDPAPPFDPYKNSEMVFTKLETDLIKTLRGMKKGQREQVIDFINNLKNSK